MDSNRFNLCSDNQLVIARINAEALARMTSDPSLRARASRRVASINGEARRRKAGHPMPPHLRRGDELAD